MAIVVARLSALVPVNWAAVLTGWHQKHQMITEHTVECSTREESK